MIPFFFLPQTWSHDMWSVHEQNLKDVRMVRDIPSPSIKPVSELKFKTRLCNFSRGSSKLAFRYQSPKSVSMLPDRSSSITRAVRELHVTPSQVQQSVPPPHEGKEVPFGWLMESLSSKRALFSFSKHPKPPHNNSWKPKTKTQKHRTCGHSIEIMLRSLSFPTLHKWYAIYKLSNRCFSRAS